mgnify:CR=1 FL=1
MFLGDVKTQALCTIIYFKKMMCPGMITLDTGLRKSISPSNKLSFSLYKISLNLLIPSQLNIIECIAAIHIAAFQADLKPLDPLL